VKSVTLSKRSIITLYWIDCWGIGATKFCSFSRIKTKSMVFTYSSPRTITAANQRGGHRCRKPLLTWFACSWPGTKDIFTHCNKAGAKLPVGKNYQNLNDTSRDLVSTEFQLALWRLPPNEPNSFAVNPLLIYSHANGNRIYLTAYVFASLSQQLHNSVSY